MNHYIATLLSSLATAAGLAGGWAAGDLFRRYRQGAEQLDTLRRQLPQPYSALLFQERQLREMILTIRPFHKVSLFKNRSDRFRTRKASNDGER